ncbi:carboxypeptidase regulatory-like domain-containing protein [Pyxidicoccus fallax]|uniref:Carboxypeptidase regulatory-like domain-containing protein n=1 Tax=Pyxidicoccus fallax TaxID=394095 RepID=A0A848LEM6_9BACT|nr:carboxypeptidase-like regulatory domain-containing protein [Pyxidicoccus fallax]NMO15313.1 carboxypeptidase regulatory-like domain-containing protein [Pyxidicoccus fallax]NPC80577.1 carboxypeptidase regulatory-like domain-containing protein [Pyxidicoccus fallax]
MRMRSVVVVALGVLVLGVGVALVFSRLQSPSPTPASTARGLKRALPGPSTPTPPPRGALSIRGRVLDKHRAPVPGVEVSATRAMPGESLSELPCDEKAPKVPLSSAACEGAATEVLLQLIEEERGGAPVLARTTSAEDGTFQLDGLPEGTVTLWALGKRDAALRPDVSTGTDGVELVLGEGVSLAGRIVVESGAPLAGAKVTLFDVEGSRYFELLTGADGRFAFGPLPDVLYGLVASSPGLMPVYLPAVTPERLKEDLVLHASRRLVGRVLAEGRPVAGAQVRVEATSHVTTSDAQGRFSIEPLAPGDYVVWGEHADQHALARVTLDKARETETTLHLGTLLFAEGTVRDEAGNPVAGVVVECKYEIAELWLPSATTSADGRFRLGPVPRSDFLRFMVRSDAHLLHVELKRLSPSGPPLDFTLIRAVLVEGLVTDDEGQPLEGVDLYTKGVELDTERRVDPQGTKHGPDAEESIIMDLYHHEESDETGRFRLKVPAPGRYRVTTSAVNRIPLEVAVDAPATGIHLRLREGATVEGTVEDARGEPLPEVDLVLRLGPGTGASPQETASDEKGRFTLDRLPPGTHTLEATLRIGGAEHRASRTVEVSGPGVVSVTLRMDTGQSVSGLVVDEQGRPVPDAEVEAYAHFDEEDEHPGGSPATARTGPDGRFTVHHLVEGAVVLSADKPGYEMDASRSSRQDLRVTARTGARDARLVLNYRGFISGRVVRADGAPVTRFAAGIDFLGNFVRSEDGSFRLPMTQPGARRLRIQAPDFAPYERDVELAEGQDLDVGEVRLEKGRRVRGRVVDAETSEFLASTTVLLRLAERPPGEPKHLSLDSVETAHDGTFSFGPLDARPMLLEVLEQGYVPLRQPIGEGDSELELRLSRGARVEITVRDREGRPVEATVQLVPLGGEAMKAIPLHGLPTSTRIDMLESAALRFLDEGGLRFTTSGGAYTARGLLPGEYAAMAVDVPPDEAGRIRHFLAQRVRVPSHGTVAVVLPERSGSTRLRAVMSREHLPGRPQKVRHGLVPGAVPASETYEDLLLRLATQKLPLTYDDMSRAGAYEQLPAGRYTFLLLVRTEDGRHLAWSRELDLPGEGTVTLELAPDFRPVPATR